MLDNIGASARLDILDVEVDRVPSLEQKSILRDLISMGYEW